MKHLLPFMLALTLGNVWPTATATGAESPRLLPFQGRLTDQTGKAVEDGVRLIRFQIYSDPNGGPAIWNGELHRTTVNGGLVNVLLGSRNPFPDLSPADPTRSFFEGLLYLQITVDINGDGAITAADPPLLPRQVILPVVFADDAGNSRKLVAYDWADLGRDGPLLNAAIPDSKLADGAITSRLFGTNSLFIPSVLTFGAERRQMLNLFHDQYGVGVQDNSLYFRTGFGFNWYKWGIHSNAAEDAGAGGNRLMRLDDQGNLSVTGTVVATDFAGPSADARTAEITTLKSQVAQLTAAVTQLTQRLATVENKTQDLNRDEGSSRFYLGGNDYISFQYDGNVVIYRNGVAIWSSRTNR